MTNVDHIPNSPIIQKRVSLAEEDKRSMDKPKSKRSKNGHEVDNPEDDLQTAHQIELAQDAVIDPAPFRFKPYELAHMLDPKSFETLVRFGGIDGVLCGLGTNAVTGLATQTQNVSSSKSFRKLDLGAGEGASQRHNSVDAGVAECSDVPLIVLTKPNETPFKTPEHVNPAFSATLEDRRRVYGKNILPSRIAKTLLQLMWAALKDKVLVGRLLPHLSADLF